MRDNHQGGPDDDATDPALHAVASLVAPAAKQPVSPPRDTFDEADDVDVDPDDPGPPDEDPPGASFGDPLAPPRPDSRRPTVRGLVPGPRVPVAPHSVEMHRSAVISDLASSSELTALVAAAEARVDGGAVGPAAMASDLSHPSDLSDLAELGSDLTPAPRPQVRGPGLSRVQRPSAPAPPRPPSRPAPRPSSPSLPAPRPSSPSIPAPAPRANPRVQAPSAPRPLIRPAHRAVELPRTGPGRPVPPSAQPTAIGEPGPPRPSQIRTTAPGISSPYLRPKDALPVAEGIFDDAHGNTVQGLPRSQLERVAPSQVAASAPPPEPPSQAPPSPRPVLAPDAPMLRPSLGQGALGLVRREPPPSPSLRDLAPPRAESEPLVSRPVEQAIREAAALAALPRATAFLPAATLVTLALLAGAMVLPSSRGAPWELLAQPTDPTFLALAAFLLVGVLHLLPSRASSRARMATGLGLLLLPFTALSARSALAAGAFDGQPAMELLWNGGWSAALATLGSLAALMAGLMARGGEASRFAPTTLIGFGTGLALAVLLGAASPPPLSGLFSALGDAPFLGDRVGAWTALPLVLLVLVAPVFAWPGPRERLPGHAYRLDRLSVPLAVALWGAALLPMLTLALFSAKSEAWLEVFEPLKLTLVLGALTLYLAAALSSALSTRRD